MAMFGYRPPVAKAKPNPFAMRDPFAAAPESIAPAMGDVAGISPAPNLKPSFFQSGGTGNKILDALGRFAIAADANNGGQGSIAYLQNQRQRQQQEERRYAPQHVGNNIVRLDRETGQYVTDYQGRAEGGATAQEIADLRAAGATDSDIQNLIRRKTELPPQTITTTDPSTGEMRMFTVPRGQGMGHPQQPQGDVGAIMPHLIDQESGGRAGILGPQTRYGQAQGRTQMLPQTAQSVAARLGVPWRPDLMTGTSPEAAAYQDRLGQGYLQEGLAKTGNMRDALRYYHGGPDRKLWGPKTNGYADSVLRRAGQGTRATMPTKTIGGKTYYHVGDGWYDNPEGR
jgi:hypothetical protein